MGNKDWNIHKLVNEKGVIGEIVLFQKASFPGFFPTRPSDERCKEPLEQDCLEQDCFLQYR